MSDLNNDTSLFGRIPILFTIPNFVTAGSGQVLFNIVTRLDQQKFSPYICVARRGGQLEHEFESLNIPVIEAKFWVAARPLSSLMKRCYETASFFKPFRFRAWHSFHYLDDYTEPIIARLAGAKGWSYTKKSMSWGSRAWWLRSLLAKHIVADNFDMKRRFFNRFYLEKKVHEIPHGVVLENFSPRAKPSLKLRERLSLSPDDIMIVCVAHFVPVKRHRDLFKALALVPKMHLVLAGTGTDEKYIESLKDLVKELGIENRVHFIGQVDDVAALHAESDIFVLQSLSEGCPVALLEAMACGKACVATDVAGARDIIEDGRDGILVPPKDPPALATAFAKLGQSSSFRRKLGELARRKVEEKYVIEREVRAYEDLLSRL
jgi:glycosyltransferase involved in cell wall biosynthesis